MKYLCNTSCDWADEFDLTFGELLDEETYKKYKYAKDVLGSFIVPRLYFGTNEAFYDFDLLDFEFEEIPDSDAEILKKYGFPSGEGIIDRFFEHLENELGKIFPEDCKKFEPGYWYALKDDLWKCSFEIFKNYIDKYYKYLEEE